MTHSTCDNQEPALYVGGDGSLTWRSLRASIALSALRLQCHTGGSQGNAVALLLPNGVHTIVGLHALQRAGMVVCPLNPTYSVTEVEYQLEVAGCVRVVVTATGMWSVPADDVRDRRCWLVVVRTETVVAFLLPKCTETRVPLGAFAMLLFTSGTTGKPKGVPLSDANLHQHTINAHEVLGMRTNDVIILPGLPLFHIYAIAMWTLAFDAGRSVYVLPRFDLAELARSRGTVLHMVPTMAILLQSARAVPTHVRCVFTAAAPLPLDVQTRVGDALRANMLQIYGMSEVCGTLTATRMSTPGSIGTPAHEASVVLIDVEGREADEGELRVRSAQVFAGYVGRARDGDFDARDYFCTGDRAHRRDGVYYIVGRLKEQIKVGGYLVAPGAVEEALMAHPAIADVCAVGTPDPITGEAVAVYYALTQGTTVPDDMVTLRTWCDARLVEYKRPVHYMRVPHVQRSAAGKLLRRAMLEAHPFPVQKEDDCVQETCVSVDALGGMLYEATGVKAGADAPLLQAGVTSMQALRFAAAVAARTGTSHEPTLVFVHGTLRAIAEAFAPHTAPVAPLLNASPRSSSSTTTVRFDAMAVSAAASATLPSGRQLARQLRYGGCACASVADRFDADDLPDAALLMDVARFDATAFGVMPSEAASMDPQQRLLLETAGACRAGVDGVSDVAVAVGVSSDEWHARQMRAQCKTAYAATAGTPSVAAGRLAYVFDLHGPTHSVDTACSSALVALAHAAHAMAGGDEGEGCRGGALTAAVNVILEVDFTRALAAAGMLSPRGRCHSFDVRADGYARAEGIWASALVQGSGALALAAPVKVRQDGRTASLTAPSGARQRQLLGTPPTPVLEAHGTGTQLGDAVEIGALAHAASGTAVVVGSAKANLAHGEPAAGAYGVAKAALQLGEARVYANAMLHILNPHLSLDSTCLTLPTQLHACAHRLAGVSSFGYSGTIAHARLLASATAGALSLLTENAHKAVRVTRVPLTTLDEQLWRPSHTALRAMRVEAEARLEACATVGVPPQRAHYAVVVVGGGLAGLTNACVAADAGCAHVLVIDKARQLGGTWAHYGNATSRVNSSEPAYRLYGSAGAKRNHTHLPDVLHSAAEAIEARAAVIEARLGCTATAIQSGRVAGVVCGGDAAFSVDGFVIACTNRRLGVPRVVPLAGEVSHFRGVVATGLRDSTAHVAFLDKTVVVYGMGAFALENVRTALEAGANFVHVVCRRGGTVCPQIVDYINFAQRLDPATWERDPRLSARVMAAWRKLHADTGTPTPACWDEGILKPDGHTVSVADVWFLAHHHKRVALHLASLEGIDADGALRLCGGARLEGVDVLIKSTGFELHKASGVLPSDVMHGAGVLDVGLMVQVESHLDEKFFHSPFGSSYLLQAEVHAHVFQHLRAHPDAARSLIAGGGANANVTIDTLTAAQHYSGLRDAAERLPAVHKIVAAFVHRSADRCADYLSMAEYVTYNARQWRMLDRLLRRGRATASCTYPFGEFRSLEEDTEAQTAPQPCCTAATTVSLAQVTALLRTMAEGADADAPIMDAGLDSIAVIEFRNVASEQFGVALPATILFDSPTARALACHLGGTPSSIAVPFLTLSRSAATRGVAVNAHSLAYAGGVNGMTELWRATVAAADLMAPYGAVPWTAADADAPACRHGGFADGTDLFDARAFDVKAREASSMDPQQRLVLTLVEDARRGRHQGAPFPSDGSVHVGAGYADFAMLNARGDLQMDTYTGAGGYLGVLSGRISFCYGLHGPCVNVDTSCSSGLVAAHAAAATLLQPMAASLGVCAAVFLMLFPWAHRQLARAGMLSSSGRCHTFDATADGFARGEAGVALLLVPDHVDAGTQRYVASAVRQDGRSASLTAPNGTAQRALHAAVHNLEEGGRSSDRVETARHEAHGTGTALGDPIETGALAASVMEQEGRRRWLSVSSIKSQGGHAEPAAGLVGLCASLLAMARPCARLRRLNTHVAPTLLDSALGLCVSLGDEEWTRRTASGVASFGVNGTIAAAKLESGGYRLPTVWQQRSLGWRRRRLALPWARTTAATQLASRTAYAIVWPPLACSASTVSNFVRLATHLSPEEVVHEALAAAHTVVTCGVHAQRRWTHAGVGAALRSAAREGIGGAVCVDVDADGTPPRCAPGELEVRVVAGDVAVRAPRLRKVPHANQPPCSCIQDRCMHALFGGGGDLGGALATHLLRLCDAASVRVVPRASVDVTQCAEVTEFLNEAALSAAPLPVVWMLAGTLRDGSASRLTVAATRAVFAPKVGGAANVHAALSPAPGATLVLFSSIAALGSAGQANYAAANACLNVLADQRRSMLGLAAHAPCWGPWHGLGLARGVAAAAEARAGLRGLCADEGLALLDAALAPTHPPVLVLAAYADRAETAPYLAAWWEEKRNGDCGETRCRCGGDGALAAVRSVAPDAVTGATLEACGVDSLAAIELRAVFARDFGVTLALDAFDGAATVGALVARVTQKKEEGEENSIPFPLTPGMAWRALAISHTTDVMAVLAPHLRELCTWAQGTGGVGTVVRQRVTLGAGVDGHVGVLHGGVTALLMDDTMGVLASVTGSCSDDALARCGVTASLEVQYKHPCHTGGTVELHARYDRIEGRKHFLECELRGCDNDGVATTVLATGRSLYIFPAKA